MPRFFSTKRLPAFFALLIACCAVLWAGSALAEEAAPAAAAAAPAAPAVNSGDTAWVLTSAALVFLMTVPGLALFYGGLVRKKNVLSVLMQCFFIVCLVTIEWVVLGYSMAFGPDAGGGLVGNLSYAFLNGVGQTPHAVYANTTPHLAFMLFQMMFAIITPALIVGAFAERMRFVPFCLFILLWSVVVYNPVCHWVWSPDGFLCKWGSLDFAGGTVVHINAGMAALACALFLGKRKGYPDRMSPPHNLPFALIGAALLWFGWFGFNAGSAVAANGLAASAFMTTQVATALAAITWALMDFIFVGRATVLGVITGAVAGLVAITPAAGFVNLWGAVFIGIAAGIVPWIMVSIIKPKLGYDDSLDAFGVHGVGGMVGALLTGLFATSDVNSLGQGLFYGKPEQLWLQFEAIAITMIYSFVVTLVLLVIVNVICKLRADEHEETVGLDLSQHRETAYTVIN